MDEIAKEKKKSLITKIIEQTMICIGIFVFVFCMGWALIKAYTWNPPEKQEYITITLDEQGIKKQYKIKDIKYDKRYVTFTTASGDMTMTVPLFKIKEIYEQKSNP